MFAFVPLEMSQRGATLIPTLESQALALCGQQHKIFARTKCDNLARNMIYTHPMTKRGHGKGQSQDTDQ